MLRNTIITLILLVVYLSSATTILHAQSLIAYYPFNGDAADKSGNSHDGTVINATLISDRFGKPRSAYQFTGNDYIQVDHAPDFEFGTGDFTICAWIKFCSQEPEFAGIVAKQQPSGPSRRPGYQLVIRDINKASITVETISDFTEPIGGTSLGDNSWHFLVAMVARSASTITIYVDGVQYVTSPDVTGTLDNIAPMYIGRDRDAVRYFKGEIDDIRIYKGLISNDTMMALYHENGWTGGSADQGGLNSTLSLCQGNSLSLDAENADSYLWSTGARTSSISVASSGTYWVSRTISGGCKATDTFTVTLRSSPAIHLKDESICQGSSITIGQTPSGGTPPYSYQWSPATGLSSTTAATPVANPTTTTLYTVTLTDAGGCTTTGSVTVAIKAGPQVQSAPDLVLCRGDSVTLRPNVSGGSGKYSFSWAPDPSLSATAVPTPVARPTGTTVYHFAVDDGGGCILNDSIRVVVSDPPKAAPGGTIMLCQGGSRQLNGGASGGTAPYRYSWSPGAGLSASDIATPMANPQSTTTYILTVTDANGCRDSAKFTVNVGASLNGFTQDLVVCTGSSVTIGEEASGGTPPYSYQWSPSAGLSSATVAMPIANPTTTRRYTVTVTDASGCIAVGSTTVTIKAGPQVQSAPDLILCRGDSVTLQPNVNGGSGNYTYAWGADPSLSATTVPTPLATPTGTTVYHFTVDDGGGCVVSDSIRVVVPDPPKAVAGGDITLCQGSSGTIAGGVSGGTAPYRYHWSPSQGLSATDIATPTAMPTTTTTYRLVVTDANGCRDSSEMHVVVVPRGLEIGSTLQGEEIRFDTTRVGTEQCDSIRVRNIGVDTVEVAGLSMERNVEFSVPPSQASMRIAPGEERWVEICYRPQQTEEDRDTLTLNSLCLYRIAVAAQGLLEGKDHCGNVLRIRSIDSLVPLLRLGMPYPNPSAKIVTIDVERGGSGDRSIHNERCLLYDALGRIVCQADFRVGSSGGTDTGGTEHGSFDLDVSGLPQGFYVATVATSQGTVTMPIVIDR